MNTITTYILKRLTERSTWVGLTGAATALGVTLSPDHATTIAVVGAGLASFVQAAFADHKPVLKAIEEAVADDVTH